MSLSATTTVEETGASAGATSTTTGGSSGHQQKPIEGQSGGDGGSSTVISSNTTTEDLIATSASAAIVETKHQIGQPAVAGGGARIRTTRGATIRRRHEVKEFNDVISCYLCHGYLINATTIDYCVHSFCRSCIVKHLQEDKHCPQCRPGSKQIGLSNLKPDERLKALVFKLVPGLHQREHQRQQQFYSETTQSKSDEPDDSAWLCDAEEDYFSPVEPISLSLEYHPESLQGCGRQHIPPIRYLQCPAAVTMHHLKRFISSKFDIDPENERVDIEIIYEDEVLPEDFSLMDVGYCYSWKRIAPMRFFYRILVYSLCNKLVQVPSDSVVTEGDTVVEAKRVKKSNEANVAQKSVRFKELTDKQTKHEQPVGAQVAYDQPVEVVPGETSQAKYSIFKAKGAKHERGNDTQEERRQSNNIETTKIDKITRVSAEERCQVNGGKGPVKMTIIARKPSDIKMKHDSNKSKNKSKIVPIIVPPVVEIPAATSLLSDFKSLRSNDIRYSDFSLGPSGAVSTTTVPNSAKKSNLGKSKSTSIVKETPQKVVTKSDIVVSIPQSHVHRSSNSSDDSFENLSLAQLKTANKKISSTTNVVTNAPKPNCGQENIPKPLRMEEQSKPDVPKLKIELPSLKTKISVPKKSPEGTEIKKSPKSRKHSVEEQLNAPAINQVDLTTYAKNIGLKPINPVVEEKEVKVSPNNSPSSGSSSTSSPPSTSGSAFNFSPEIGTSSSHKKRKKAKHSKEPKEPGSKRRKLHAEIASQPAEESLKLKVKITANHKSHKAEKRLSSSCSVEEVTTSMPITAPVVLAGSKMPSVEPILVAKPVTTVKVVDCTTPKSPAKSVSESKPAQDITKPTNRNKHGVNISNLNKALSEESLNINNLFKENSAPKPMDQVVPSSTSKQSVVPCKPKAVTSVGNKGITVTSVTIVTSAHTPSFNTVNQSQPKAIAPKIRSIQDTKIPISPPLPPSLFKTAPMTLQTISTTSTKPSPSQTVPRLQTSNDMRHLPANQVKRFNNPVNQKAQGNFVVPNPPKSLPNSPKLCPIPSIASAANRQAAQLKRSASLDSNPPILAKQQKLDSDRLVRKASYTPFIAPTSTSVNISAPTSLKPQNNSLAVVTSTLDVKPIDQQNFYTSTMGPTYTREVLSRKPMPILLPPSSISVTKMTDVIPSKLTHPGSGVTITSQQSQMATTYPPQQQKPALEILRISSNIPPIDQQPIAVINNNTVKPSPTKTTRPPPPPIPLVKIKRSVSQGNSLKTSITTVNAPVQQTPVSESTKSAAIIPSALTTPSTSVTPAPPAPPPPAPVITSATSIVASKVNTTVAAKSPEIKIANGQSPICDNIGALDLSGKSSRSPSQEKTTPTSSPPDTPTQTACKDSPVANKQIANNLEAALSKLKQQSPPSPRISSPQTSGAQVSTTAVDTVKSQAAMSATTPAATAFKTPKSPSQTTPKEPEANNGLQNLKMLSESATNCEKITIKSQRMLPVMPKLNEISKMRANPTVRQQNASVRNIPNPSALAFRSHQPIPMLASITKTTSPQKITVSSSVTPPTTATATTTSSSAAFSEIQKTQEASLVSGTQTTNSVAPATLSDPNFPTSSASVTITTVATTDSSKLIGSKKNHLEQLTASLNLRALSAAANALKQSSTGSNSGAGAIATCGSVSEGGSPAKTALSPPSLATTTAPSATTATSATTAPPTSDSSTVTISLPASTVYSTVTISATSTSPAVSATSA